MTSSFANSRGGGQVPTCLPPPCGRPRLRASLGLLSKVFYYSLSFVYFFKKQLKLMQMWHVLVRRDTCINTHECVCGNSSCIGLYYSVPFLCLRGGIKYDPEITIWYWDMTVMWIKKDYCMRLVLSQFSSQPMKSSSNRVTLRTKVF